MSNSSKRRSGIYVLGAKRITIWESLRDNAP